VRNIAKNAFISLPAGKFITGTARIPLHSNGVHAAGLNEGDFRKWVESQSPLGRIGQPNDISPTAVYLASSDSKYLTGEIIRVTPGIL
jgi:3-oxoacyl-[acyl-carrier protein] reductase